MKTLFAALALATVLPAAAQAQDTQTEDRRVIVLGGPGHRLEIPEEGLTRDAFLSRHQEMFARLDANADGRITRDEMQAMHSADGGDADWTSETGDVRIVRRGGPGGEEINLEGLDDGGDRQIVIVRRGPGGETIDVDAGEGGERQVFVFRHDGPGGLDADGDGRLTFEEMSAPLRQHFNQMDANGDGFVDEAERGH